MGDNLTMANNFEKMDILIFTRQDHKLNEVIMLEVGNETFPIRIKERGLVEKPIRNQKRNRDQMAREEDASSEVEEANKSESKLSSERRRNDGIEGFIKIGLENERNDNGVQEGPRDWVSADEIEEEIQRISQNKRINKVLNKKIRSM
ncbi:hypothetical protein J1N35_026085 [Gossypium stocksii]|uniref:Uncharacterized protein n=1 Tax=Gossypium stocksii TaxID=47602 RepID=A0A9D3ZXT5_9ROSI|nr:hypothetical protein J1N35_026085 [Gossypium stocksii]